MRWAVFVALLGCGRVAFDPLGDGGGAGSGSGSGSGSDAATVCPGVSNCPDQTLSVGLGPTSAMQMSSTNHGLSSTMCSSGTSNPEIALLLMPTTTATYTFSVSPAVAAAYVQDQCCGGTELMCGLPSTMSVQRNAGQRMVLLLEIVGAGPYTITVTGN